MAEVEDLEGKPANKSRCQDHAKKEELGVDLILLTSNQEG